MYDSAAAQLKLVSATNQEKDCNPNDLSLITKEGASISVELKFLEVIIFPLPVLVVRDSLAATVKMWKIWVPEKIAVIILKFKQCGFMIEKCVRKMQTEWQTV